MKFFAVLLAFVFSSSAHAWGRHDLITQIALDSAEFSELKTLSVTPESIEDAAPDLLNRVIPDLEKWCLHYHEVHDTRYAWKAPEALPGLTARASLLWSLEDNRDTPLPVGTEKTAADILIRYVDEPDGLLDSGMNRSPYIERLRSSMSYFDGNDAQTHAFRHYYVPTSLVPPILTPKGIAPYRAGMYAYLSEGAFRTGHPYWGYRFLAWSIHYLQDVTQPWHTVFLPGISFLQFSKSAMKHEVSALHYLSEAFVDAWMQRVVPERSLASLHPNSDVPLSGPWSICELTEKLAKAAHDKASEIASAARDFFAPVVDKLSDEMKPTEPWISFGGLRFATAKLDFSTDGAADFLQPMWNESFNQPEARDHLLGLLLKQVNSAVEGSRDLISSVLDRKPHLAASNGAGVSARRRLT